MHLQPIALILLSVPPQWLVLRGMHDMLWYCEVFHHDDLCCAACRTCCHIAKCFTTMPCTAWHARHAVILLSVPPRWLVLHAGHALILRSVSPRWLVLRGMQDMLYSFDHLKLLQVVIYTSKATFCTLETDHSGSLGKTMPLVSIHGDTPRKFLLTPKTSYAKFHSNTTCVEKWKKPTKLFCVEESRIVLFFFSFWQCPKFFFLLYHAKKIWHF